MTNPISMLRKAALIEGVSFLLLLGIAMPLKYIWDMPMAVKLVGWAHGLLFMWLCLLLLVALKVARWPILRALEVFIAALLPFGPFLLDKRMRRYVAEFENSRSQTAAVPARALEPQ